MTERLWAPWRLEYVAGGEQSGCIFCDQPGLDDDDAALMVHRGERACVMMNLYPYANGHMMVAPYRHLAEPGALDEAERAEMWRLLDHAVAALRTAFAPDGFNCGINLGRVAGVEGHIHLHVVPRWSGDTNFMPVLADVRVMPEHLSRTLEKLRAVWPAA